MSAPGRTSTIELVMSSPSGMTISPKVTDGEVNITVSATDRRVVVYAVRFKLTGDRAHGYEPLYEAAEVKATFDLRDYAISQAVARAVDTARSLWR